MISKSQVKHIRSLDDKKNRYACGQFVVEGEKMLSELLASSWEIEHIYATDRWIKRQQLPTEIASKVTLINELELSRISSFKTPHEVLALVSLPKCLPDRVISKALALDQVQDPGNVGTIIRIADWFGIRDIICSENTADCFNPKVLQATMGSVFRVNCYYTELSKFLQEHKQTTAYACVLGGKDIRSINRITDGILVIGNESKGISSNVLALCEEQISIPRFGQAESLNAAVAAGIICHSLWK